MVTNMGKPICGVYLLRGDDGSILYVGQSVNVLSRVGTHASDISKMFAGVTVLECAQDHLDLLEGLLIHAINPPLNAALGPRPNLVKATQHWGNVPKRIREATPLSWGPEEKDCGADALDKLIKKVQRTASAESHNNNFLKSADVIKTIGHGTQKSLRDKSNAGEFPMYKLINGRYYWRRQDVLEWLSEQ